MGLFTDRSLDEYSPALQDKIDHAKIEGWKVYETKENEVKLVKRKRASFFWHVVLVILTSWWTLGVGNLLYWLKCRYGDAQYITLREAHIEEEDDVFPPS